MCVQLRRYPHERVADGCLQRSTAAVSEQGGAADHVHEAHVPERGTDMEVGLDGMLVGHPAASVLVPQRQLAAAREWGTGGAAATMTTGHPSWRCHAAT